MSDNQFEWDGIKAKINLQKHDVSFDESVTIFNDPLIVTMPDVDHSETEQRFISIGMSVKGILLVVIYTERDERIRLISCRKATKREIKFYENI
jgi:uncharacterized DUF497 family protein